MTHRNASALNLNSLQAAGQAGAHAPEAWLDRMRRRLDPQAVRQGAAAEGAEPQAGRAAVLAPLVLRDGRLHVILTVRPDDLPSHPGQISLPGGRIHAGETAADAALRETHEEIGIAPHQVELLGAWEPIVTVFGVHVTPFAGLVHADAVPRACPREVAEIFTAPLDFLLDPANHAQEWLERDGKRRHFTAIRHEGRYIWGATAAMLGALSARLSGAD